MFHDIYLHDFDLYLTLYEYMSAGHTAYHFAISGGWGGLLECHYQSCFHLFFLRQDLFLYCVVRTTPPPVTVDSSTYHPVGSVHPSVQYNPTHGSPACCAATRPVSRAAHLTGEGALSVVWKIFVILCFLFLLRWQITTVGRINLPGFSVFDFATMVFSRHDLCEIWMKRSGELLEVNNCSLLLSIQAVCPSSSSKQQLLKKTAIQAIRAKSPRTPRTLSVRKGPYISFHCRKIPL